MKIALDYDDTYTKDHELWSQFIKSAQRRGHDVWIVTMRFSHEAIEPIRGLDDIEVPVVYTGRQGKKSICKERNLFFDIWIDDHPEYVIIDHPEHQIRNGQV